MAAVAIPTAAAVLVYKVLAPKKITIIEILPDSPGERGPKPINKDSTPNPKQDTSSLGGETLLTPLVPLDLTPIHRHSGTKVSGRWCLYLLKNRIGIASAEKPGGR